MFERIQFYLTHSLNDLRVNRQLSFFALLSIAAGVAAIVSLQTLGVMITDTLTGNLQSTNRGDIQVSLVGDFGIDTETENALQVAIETGLVVEDETGSAFGGDATQYITTEGISAIEAWGNEKYPNVIEFDYGYVLSDFMGQLLGSGLGTTLITQDTGFEARQLAPVLVNAEVYPFYDTVTSVSGETLTDLMQLPTDILVNQQIAQVLEVEIGDEVQINGASTTFTIRGFVTAEQEVKDPFSGLLVALFGFYYMDNDALQYFEDVPQHIANIRLKINDPELVSDIDKELISAFPYLGTQTTVDLAKQNEGIANALNQLVTIMGLVSLLIGSIGIINTMQVIVRRRMLEVAVLKTIGLLGYQVTMLFLMEAFLIGLIGSLIGVVMGWGLTFGLKSVAETFVAQPLAFRISISPALNGLVVGTLVATIFGLMPTLATGAVRPSAVLRPNDNIVPRTGRLQILGALVVTLLALTLVTQTILGSFQTAFLVTLATFVSAGVIYGLLSLIIIIIGRLFPSFGIVDLKISLRQMLASRSRAATTLLALVVGVFSLSLITLFAESTNAMLVGTIEGIGGNVLITTQIAGQRDNIETLLEDLDGINSYQRASTYSLSLVEMRLSDGTVLSQEDIIANIAAGHQQEFEESPFDLPEDAMSANDLARETFGNLESVDEMPFSDLSLSPLEEGRSLQSSDIGTQVVYIQTDETTDYAGIVTGAQLVYEYTSSGLLGLGGNNDGETITFEVVGTAEKQQVSLGMGGSAIVALEGAFPEDKSPTQINYIVDVNDDDLGVLRRNIAGIPGTFIIDTSVFTQLIEGILSAFTAFPSMVATLGLIVGGVVIANSVVLTTLERRREIAVMKAMGLQRERVLLLLLIENGILGFIGGLVGVGIGLVGLAVMLTSGGLGSAIPYGTAFLLMLLCILVSLIAALVAAWNASGEKPLTVLRYE
jgi:ABC-type antimicrobial peptide transport system permease subunit